MFQLYESTTIVNDIYSTSMNFIDTVAAGNGGGLCLFGSPGSNVTLRGPIFTGTSAINGVRRHEYTRYVITRSREEFTFVVLVPSQLTFLLTNILRCTSDPGSQ